MKYLKKIRENLVSRKQLQFKIVDKFVWIEIKQFQQEISFEVENFEAIPFGNCLMISS